MKINLTYDASTAQAPADFTQQVQQAAQAIESSLVDRITVNITVSYNPARGPATGGAVGRRLPYADVVSALQSVATSADDLAALSHLPDMASIVGGLVFASRAQQKAWGLIDASAPAEDGRVTFTSGFTGPSLYSAALHEITHAMGRVEGVQDLFRYDTATGQLYANPDPAAPRASYFSIDGGSTHLANFGVTSDLWDFVNDQLTVNDPFTEFTGSSYESLSPLDITVMDVLGFHRWETIRPTLLPTSPFVNALNLPTNGTLRLDFSEAILPGSNEYVIHRSDGTIVARLLADNSAITYGRDSASISLAGLGLMPGTHYYLTFDAGVVEDLSHNPVVAVTTTQLAFGIAPALASTPGNDLLSGGPSDDQLDGGAGIDRDILAATFAQATVTHDAANHRLIVSTPLDGVDTTARVEQFQFADGLHSFVFGSSASALVADFGLTAGGWTSQNAYPRHIADINGDHRPDIIGFGQPGVFAAYALPGGGYSATTLVATDFGSAQGWTSNDSYPRLLADLNGDGRADIVGFGQAGTLVSLARPDGTFGAPSLAVADFGSWQGWSSQDAYPRLAGDVNGDGKIDLVGFGQAGTLVALGNGDGTFRTPLLALADFGKAEGWVSDDAFHRTLADVNGDGRADIVGFGQNGTLVAFGNADGTFQPARFATGNFGMAQYWTNESLYPRFAADINHDGKVDLIAMGGEDTWNVVIAFGNGDGSFSQASTDIRDFTLAQGWSSMDSLPRELADMNGDGLPDIVGFSDHGVLVQYNQADYLL